MKGSQDKPKVHHIDGDRSNDQINNLVTLSKEVHDAIHNGARAYTENDMRYWDKARPDYTKELRKRIAFMQQYVEYLHKMGYVKACMESILGRVLFGKENPCMKLHIRSRGKKRDGWYWVVVLEPTGYHSEPEDYKSPYNMF
jgi:hypothetical protein